MILATWFKRNLKRSVLGKIYVGQNKIDGVNIADKNAKQKIYDQYLESFKQGAYDYIKEEYDPNTQEVVPRKYFSGGADLINMDESMRVVDEIDGEGLSMNDASTVVSIALNPKYSDDAMMSNSVITLEEEIENRQMFGGKLANLLVWQQWEKELGLTVLSSEEKEIFSIQFLRGILNKGDYDELISMAEERGCGAKAL